MAKTLRMNNKTLFASLNDKIYTVFQRYFRYIKCLCYFLEELVLNVFLPFCLNYLHSLAEKGAFLYIHQNQS